MKSSPKLLLIRGMTGVALSLTVFWLIPTHLPMALVIVATSAALVAIDVGQRGEARYGRRVPVTEMFALGRQGDRAMLLGGLCGYLMAGCLIAACVIYALG